MTRIPDGYNVLDTTFFLALLMDTIDIDRNERIAQSEIALLDDTAREGKIYNAHHFKQIIDYYITLNGDTNIRNVPWNDLIQFQQTQPDFNHLHPDLMRYVLPNKNPEEFEEILIVDYNDSGRFYHSDEIELLENLDIVTFSPILACDYQFNQFGYNYAISFLYNIRTQKAFRFEFQN